MDVTYIRDNISVELKPRANTIQKRKMTEISVTIIKCRLLFNN